MSLYVASGIAFLCGANAGMIRVAAPPREKLAGPGLFSNNRRKLGLGAHQLQQFALNPVYLAIERSCRRGR